MLKKSPRKLKRILKKILPGFLYSYFFFKLYNIAQKLTGYYFERKICSEKIGYYPDIKNPESYNEKILWKKLYDRNPLLPVVSDKYRVREYLKNYLGEDKSEKILIPLLFASGSPEDIPFDDLPKEYIIKANNACKRYIIAEEIENRKQFTVKEQNESTILIDSEKTRRIIAGICKKWLSISYGLTSLEWAYQEIKRLIIIERLLKTKDGQMPVDYKFNIIHGKCELIQVYYDTCFISKRSWYTPQWDYINIPRGAEYCEKPAELKEMIELAEFLGKPFDFIRVDLFLADSRIYFCELTSYPMGARTPFYPKTYDFELGSKWTITPGYWQKK